LKESHTTWKGVTKAAPAAEPQRRSKAMHTALRVLILALALPGAAAANPWMAGKTKTDRTVRCETVVPATPAEAYRLWTTDAGVKRFFAPDAHIDARPGGRYEILFAPDRDPLGLSHGTAGAHVLRLVPARLVAFEWIAFAADSTLGKNAPPVAPAALRTPDPLP